jgi:menaquinone-dependent protoporphyrinogen oxidase
MDNRILVAYATRAGSTIKVAETIGEALNDAGATVDVQNVKNVNDISPYSAVVLGSAVRAGKWMSEAVKFVKTYEESLSQMPVAYFVVCLTMKEDTAEKRKEVLAYLDPIKEQTPQVQPIDVGLFAGAFDMSKLSFLFRLVMKSMKASEGDFRDLKAVRKWTRGIADKLLRR